jgi:hypothetical protein
LVAVFVFSNIKSNQSFKGRKLMPISCFIYSFSYFDPYFIYTWGDPKKTDFL